MKTHKSFTLIELLIVITIIGILAVALVPRIAQGPARARDVQRKADLQQLATAMELYYADYGEYPNDGFTGTTQYDCIGDGDWIDDALDSYIDLPTDPNSENTLCSGDSEYFYKVMSYSAGGSSPSAYALAARMEHDAAGDQYFCTGLTATWLTENDLPAFISKYIASGSCPDENIIYIYYH